MNNWETIRLGDAARFINGYAFKPKDWKTEGLEIIRIQNLTKSNGLSNYYDGELDPRYKVIKGDFLISWSATLGIFEWRGNDAWLNQHIFKVVFDKKEFDKSFFKHLIAMSLDAMGRETHGSTMKHITKPRFDNFQIPYPPLAEQKQIAAILDAADSLRQKDQQLVEHYTALSQSLFLEMFGDPETNPMRWECRTLNELVSKLGDGLHGTPTYSEEGEYYFINGNNLQNGVIQINSQTKKVSSEEFNKHKKELNESTMLVSINGTIGKVAFYRGENIVLGKSACYFNVQETLINKIFLYRLIESPYFIKYASGLATGSTIKNVSLKTMRNFPVPTPPKELQNQFAERIAIIEQQKQQAQANLENSEALFNSLLQRAFTGELTADRAA
ncbi:Type I restriction-modification system, specificity subunit S [Methylophaga frappieri]|uniref:Type I restriction-modification system, specificity subunit S n=1 Tax=Methylophaga frappieri (strain ATCC BAA-2434 / DSM 25690 / JAM7) TaxID=754477 RepID=I1YLM6_METFJ|nr:restriction endonuclease subunit S [Methylophaga frappieri]AFJ03819.1 Type I restriction-modification system, specificity subunit S [Methylophaga frappieri]